MIGQVGSVKASSRRRDMRELERDEVDFCAAMRRPGGGRLDARVVNISSRGFMVRIDGIFQEGEPVLIDLPVVGEVRAKVAWALGGRMGAQLAAPIGPEDYLRVLAVAATRPRPRWPA